jgi:hypothetical protein
MIHYTDPAKTWSCTLIPHDFQHVAARCSKSRLEMAVEGSEMLWCHVGCVSIYHSRVKSRKHTHSWYLQVDLVILALITI